MRIDDWLIWIALTLQDGTLVHGEVSLDTSAARSDSKDFLTLRLHDCSLSAIDSISTCHVAQLHTCGPRTRLHTFEGNGSTYEMM